MDSNPSPITETVNLFLTNKCFDVGSYKRPQNKMKRSNRINEEIINKEKNLDSISFKKERDNEVTEEFDEVTEEFLNKLLSNLSLCEIEEIQTSDNVIDKTNLKSSENYFEAIGDKEEINKLSPWTPDGPFLKSTPGFSEMSGMIEKGICRCLLLHCEEEVFTGKIQLLKATPWYFMCQNHRRETSYRYGYGPSKIL